MNRSIKSIGIFLLAFTAIFSSCKKDELESAIKGKGKLSISYNDIAKLKADYDVSGLLVSIEKLDGTPVMSNARMELYGFSGEFYSEEIELEEGDYILTSFMVVNSSNEVVYIAPQEWSEQAQFVSQALPIFFNVYENEVSYIIPDVIDINNCDCNAESFGYAAFSFNIVDVCPEVEDTIIYPAESFIHIEVMSDFIADTLNFFFLADGTCKLHIGSILRSFNADELTYQKGMLLGYIEQATEIGAINDPAIIEKIALLAQEIDSFEFESNNDDPCFSNISINKNIIYQGYNFGQMNVLNIATSLCGQDVDFNTNEYAMQVSAMIDELIGENINLGKYLSSTELPAFLNAEK